MDRIAVIAFTEQGCRLAQRLAKGLIERGIACTASVSGPERLAEDFCIETYGSLTEWTAQVWPASDALLFVSASGIAVRAIAPHVRDKFTDPAVVSVDECGRFAVPLLSGHVGGANDLARAVAKICGGQACISTATDVNSLFAVDEWARKNGLIICERVLAKEVSAALLAGQSVGFASDFPVEGEVPEGIVRCDVAEGVASREASGASDAPEDAVPAIGFHVALDEQSQPFERTLHLVPRIVTVGAGCHRDQSYEDLRAGVLEALDEAHVSLRAVSTLASIDVKADEKAMHELARNMEWDLVFYTADELNAIPGEFAASDFVKKIVGTDNVCERAAVAGGAQLIAGKRAAHGVTAAIAVASFKVRF